MLVGVLLALTAPGGAARAMQGPPDWVEELSLADKVAEGSVALAPRVYSASHVSPAEVHTHLARLGLERLGLDGGVVLDPEVSIRGERRVSRRSGGQGRLGRVSTRTQREVRIA